MQLFDPVVAASRPHPHFKTLLRQDSKYVCDVLNDWARGFVDRDGKFVEEFQTTFNSGFWELYLFAVLKKYGMPVDFSKVRPDFCIPSLNFNIEACIASNAHGAPPEHERAGIGLPEDFNVFNAQTILRLSNSLTAKHRKYIESYASLTHVRDRPFVVAVAAFDQPYSHLAAQRPIEAVLLQYYVNEDDYLKAGRPGGRLDGEELTHVLKKSGNAVELGLFSSPAYREISAVIFSACANWGKTRALASDPTLASVFTALRLNPSSDRPHVTQLPKRLYTESLVDGLRVYHNPFATHPLDPALFRHPNVFQLYFENQQARVEQREGLLLSRFVMTLREREQQS
jgi:hypothetical protein